MMTSVLAAPETVFLDGAICWHLLGREQQGRLAILMDGGADVVPVSYLSRQGRLFFRSAPGTDIRELTEHPRVALEVDGRTVAAHWNVVVRGMVRRLNSESEIPWRDAGALRSSRRGERFTCFELRPEQISGRLVLTRD